MMERTIRRRAAARPALILLAASLVLTSGPTFIPRPARGTSSSAALRRAAAGANRPLSAIVRRVPRLKAVLAEDGEVWDRTARAAARARPLPPVAAPGPASRR